jgi:hypothetical protein
MFRATIFMTLVVVASACSLEPGFGPDAGTRSYGCYTEPGSSDFTVEFQGKTALIVDQGRSIAMEFVPSVWPRFKDRYKGGGYVLTLDPEASLRMPDGRTRGPCN